MGLVFPPVRMIAFVVSATSKTNPVTVYTGCCILILSVFIITILLMIYPQLAPWLSSRMQ
jgi:C4-dicarboxylate transporter, DctM subunit